MQADDSTDLPIERSEASERAVRLVLSRIVGEVKGRHVGPQICRLVGEAFAIPGPWPDEEYSLKDLDCDWDAIAARWTVVSAAGESLPDEVIAAFFPKRLWSSFWRLIALGPVGATRRIESTLQAAGHGLTLDGNLRPNGALSAITVDGLSASFGRFARAVIELRKQSLDPSIASNLPSEFGAWTRDALPQRRSAFELGARQQRRNNTKAVRLRLARLTLQMLDNHIERNRRPSYQLGLYLRNRVLIGILLLGPRIGTVAALDVGDYERAHKFPDGTIGPALHFRRLKGMPGVARWRGIPPTLGKWIDDYFAYFEIADDRAAPFWVTKRQGDRQMRRPTTVTLSAAVTASFARVQPKEDSRDYRPHSLRHLAEQVCFDAALQYLNENRRELLHDENGRGLPANPQVFCDCLLDHALHDISDRYKDINSADGREIWGRLAALLVWDYVWGSKGARTIPNIKRIREARVQLEEARRRETETRARIARLEDERESLGASADEQLHSVLGDLDALDDAAKWRAHFEQAAATRQLSRLDTEIKRKAFALVELARDVERAAREFELAQSSEMCVADALTDDHAAQLEASPQLRPETTLPLGMTIARRVFNVDEFLWAFGGAITARDLGRCLEGCGSYEQLFVSAASDQGRPRGVTLADSGETLIAFDELPIERYHPAVIERLQWLMAFPRGAAPIARRRRRRPA